MKASDVFESWRWRLNTKVKRGLSRTRGTHIPGDLHLQEAAAGCMVTITSFQSSYYFGKHWPEKSLRLTPDSPEARHCGCCWNFFTLSLLALLRT